MNCPGNKEIKEKEEDLIIMTSAENIKMLYEEYKTNPKIKWKDSIKKLLD